MLSSCLALGSVAKHIAEERFVIACCSNLLDGFGRLFFLLLYQSLLAHDNDFLGSFFLLPFWIFLASFSLVYGGAYLIEDWQTLLVWNGDVESTYLWVSDLVNPCLHQLGVLVEQVLISSSLRVEIWKISRRVAELAPESILTRIRCSHERAA